MPIIIVTVLGRMCHALVDTGACKSLISKQTAQTILGTNFMKLVKNCSALPLRDVNNKPLVTLGQIDLCVQINQEKFHHSFIIYNGTSTDVLLGYDFLKSNKLCVVPNWGLFVQSNIEKIHNIMQTMNSFTCVLQQSFTLLPYQQRVESVKLIVPDKEYLPMITSQLMVISSDLIEPNSKFTELSVIHQYSRISPTLEANIAVINPSDNIRYYRSGEQIAHASFCQQVNMMSQESVNLCSAVFDLVSIVDGKTIKPSEDKLFLNTEEFTFDVTEINCHSTLSENKDWLNQLHIKYKNIFTNTEFNPGTAIGSEVNFEVRSNATIINQRFNRLNPRIKEEAVQIIDTLLSRRLIELSDSPWSSRLVFVHKQQEEAQLKDGNNIAGVKQKNAKRKLRLVIDLRDINRRLKSINTTWVPPTIWSIIDRLHSASFVSLMDINSGFWHFPLSKESRKLTAFNFMDFRYQCTRLPQGLKISSSVMQKKMMSFIVRNKLQGLIIYIDNIICIGSTQEEYKKNLSNFFQACSKDGYKLNNKKSHHFITESLILFGFKINLQLKTICPEPDKLSKLIDLPTPSSKKAVRSFIGGVSYFSNFIENLQLLLTPLHEIAAKHTHFIWTDKCDQAFKDIKLLIQKLPLVYLFNTEKPLHIICDGAMGSHVAYALYQMSNEGKFTPIKYNSHKLSKTEVKLSQYETEALALIFALIKEEHWLSYGNSTLHTDARSLCFLAKFNSITAKIARWNILIHSFNINVSFLPNKDAQVKFTDILTRQGQKNSYKNKVTNEMLKGFFTIDFSDVPDMNLNDIINLLIEVYAKIDNNKNLSKEKINNLFPEPPIRAYHISNTTHVMAHVNIAVPVSSHAHQDNKLPALQLPLIQNAELVSSNKIKEALINFMPNYNTHQLTLAQHQDNELAKIFSKLEHMSSHQSFFLFEKILMRKHIHQGQTIDLIVLPQLLATKLVETLHTDIYAHLSMESLIRQINTTFYIPKLQKICREIISNCKFCQLNKVYPNKTLKPGIRFHVNGPRQTIYIDICVVDSSLDFGSFLTIVDAFSKFVVLVPSKQNPTSAMVADNILNNYCKYYGYPLLICGDGASYFSSAQLGTICSMIGCKFAKIAPYNSRANISERYHQLVLNALRMLRQTKRYGMEHFEIMLSLSSIMINSVKNREGFSPFYLQHGTNPRHNNFLTMMTPEQALSKHEKALIDCSNVCYIISNARHAQRNTNKEIQNKKTYFVGQFVLLRKKSINNKIGHKLRPQYYDQLFRIVKRTATNAVIAPFNKRVLQERFYKEGTIPKRLCRLVRVDQLKPVNSFLNYLNLNINDVNLMFLDKLLHKNTQPISEVIICSTNKSKRKKGEIKAFKHSLLSTDFGQISSITRLLRTYTSNILSHNDNTFSTISIKYKNKKPISSDWSSSKQNFSFQDEYITDSPNFESLQSDEGENSTNSESESTSSSSSSSSIISVISRKSRRSRFTLPSGKQLTIYYNPDPVEQISDRKSVTLQRPEEENVIQDIL